MIGAVATLLLSVIMVGIVVDYIHERHAAVEQARLERAFGRGRRVARAGTGEQGHPYGLFSERVWMDF